MATYRGIIGTFSQSAGDLTFTTWKGVKVAKQKVPARNSSNTPAQQAQRLRFSVLAQLAGQFGTMVRTGYKTSAVKKTEQNVFTSVNYGATSYDPNNGVTVDYSMLEVSAGTVEKPFNLTAEKIAGSPIVNVQWTPTVNGGSALGDDLLYVALLNTSTDRVDYISTGTKKRSDGQLMIDVDATFVANRYRAYAFFKRANSTGASGTVSVPVQ